MQEPVEPDLSGPETRVAVVTAVRRLSAKWRVERDARTVRFLLDGYTLDLNVRAPESLVVTFDPRSDTYPPSATRDPWAGTYVQRRRLSGLHVKPDQSCWYLRPCLAEFFQDAREAGLFDAFGQVMTYGGSMGGFAALAYAGLTGARRVLSMNPQINLGPSVRSWETRFTTAVDLDWTQPICDVAAHVKAVETLAVAFDPYDRPDRRHAEMIGAPQMIALHVPFVGHRIPAHLQRMNLLNDLFTQTLAGQIDMPAFFRGARERRSLLRYKRVMLSFAKGKAARVERLERLLPADELLIR